LPMSDESTIITNCAVLNQAGATYYLTANISNSTTSNCINITAENVTLDCRNNIIDGDDEADYGIYINRTSAQTTNITIRNCKLMDWDNNIYLRNADSNTLINITSTSADGIYDGLTLLFSDSNTFINITANSNGDGISLTDSHSNTFTNVTANSNGYLRYGIYLYYSDSNTFTNVIANSNYYGIYLDESSESNTLTNITANSNYDGIRLYSSDSNTIKESEFFNNTNAGIFFHLSASRSNVIYNNLFNNTYNFNYTSIGNNSWNTSKQTGDRKISSGTQIGGNYWANLTGDGYSETCTDSEQEGFCDTPYTLAVDNIDYLPLSDEYTINTRPLVNLVSPANATYTTGSPDFKFNVTDVHNTTFDCYVYVNSSTGYGNNITYESYGRNNSVTGQTKWWSNSGIVSSLGDVGWYSKPEVFNKGGTWYLIAGESDGVFNGYNWTGSAWQSDTAIVSGLGDVGASSTSAVFNMDGTWYLIAGESDGVFNGYNWTGSAWQSDTAIVSGLGDVVSRSAPTVFNVSDTWYLISGEYNGKFYGYNWTGSAWQSDSVIAFGLGDVGDKSVPKVFNKGGTWYLVAGDGYYGVFNGFNWTGSIWQSDSGIVSGLGDIGSWSAPAVFNMNERWYLISGEYDGVFNGYNWGFKAINTTITANSTLKDGNYIWYVNCSEMGHNNLSNQSQIWNLSIDSTYPLIDFDTGTESNNSFKSQNFIYANWTYTEANLQNITAELHNTTDLVNRTGFTTATYEINWTLDDTNERYYYNISILDQAGNFNKTELRYITLDTTNPTIPNVSISPNTADDLDPNVQINVTANITDTTSGVNTTILQYKFHSAPKFINVSMRYNSITKLYNASFTPNIAGEWTYRVWANDTANNQYNTIATNVSVYKDYTWVRSPADAGTILGILTTTKEILNLTINNTGEYSLSFYISDTAPYGSSYNQSLPFTIASRGTKTIAFDATFGSTTREDAIVITIKSTTPNADPSETTTNFTLASYAGGPFFDVVIDTYPTSINQSRTAIIRAYVKNIGNETSIQTWLNWTLPSGVTNTTGNTTQNVTLNETSNLTSGLRLYNTLNITVNESTVEIGLITIYAKATGFNSTNGKISKEANKTITITCYSGDGVCGKGCNYHTDTDCEVPQNVTTTTTAAGGGGGGVPFVFKAEVTYELVRGRDQIFILPLKNTYSSKTLTNIRVSASGYLAQYIKIEPPENVSANETGEIKVKILAPSYFTVGMHNLTFTIQSVAKEKGTSDISRTEKRYVYLSIHELGKGDSEKLINEIENYLNKLKKLNLKTEGIQELFDKSLDAINKSNYEKVNEMYEQSKELAEAAFDSYSIVKGLEEKLNDTSKYGIKTPKTDRLISLAKSALERGDYLLALERVKDAQLTYIIETKGKFGLIYYIRKNTFEFFLYTIAILILLTVLYFRTRISVINYNLKGLQQEEDTLLGLMRVIQKECFEEKKMSMNEYNDAMLQYEDKLSKAVQRTIQLEASKANLLKFTHRKLELERNRLLDLMKTTQEKYLKEGAIETQVYNNKMHSFVSRLSELEENLALQEAKQTLRKRKLFWRIFYSIFQAKSKS